MSSNIRINRICQHCGKEFVAQKTTSKTCSDRCAGLAYKARQRAAKIEKSNQQTGQIKAKPVEDLKAQQCLTVDEAARLVRVSRRTLYRMNERDELPFHKLSRRTVILRADIDQLFTRSNVDAKPRPAPIPLSDCYSLAEVRQKYAISDKALYDLILRHSILKQYSGIYAYVPKVQIDAILNQ